MQIPRIGLAGLMIAAALTATAAPRHVQPADNVAGQRADSPAADAADQPAFEVDWPRWRGPRGDGTWRAPPLPDAWPAEGLPALWKRPVGGGYAGVIVADGRVYLADRQTEGGEVERLLCFDGGTGELHWTFEYAAEYGDLDYGNGPRAAPTVADGRVYVLGAVGHLHCLDAGDGSLCWSTHLVEDHAGRLPTWGFAASPFLVGELVVVQTGSEDGSVLALDRRTGRPVWRSLSDEAGYATPILIEHAGFRQLVVWTPQHVAGVEPRTGRVQWRVPYEVTLGVSIATPVFHEGIVLVSGYWEGSKAIELGGTPGAARVVWEENRSLRGLMSQPLVRDGHAYLLDKAYGLTCFELRSGRKLWDDGNRATPRGRNPQATLVWLNEGDRAMLLNSDGELILCQLTPEGYREQSRTRIIGETWAHPAYSGRRVYARSDSELVCVGLPER